MLLTAFITSVILIIYLFTIVFFIFSKLKSDIKTLKQTNREIIYNIEHPKHDSHENYYLNQMG